MKIIFIPSLEHLCCTNIVSKLYSRVLPYMEAYCLRTSRLLKNDTRLLYMDRDKIYLMIHDEITKYINTLTPYILIQKKLQSFIGPLFCEIEEWLKICKSNWSGYDDSLLTILKSVPSCWLSNGSIDREKSVRLLVKNSDIGLTYRFIFACTFCLLEDALAIWEMLSDVAKVYLQHHADIIVIQWIIWLKSNSRKDMKSFIQFTQNMDLWSRNVYLLKHVFKTLSPSEKTNYLLSALTKKEVNSDIMCFGLSFMTEKEQELILKRSPVEVFKWLSSWPIRNSFCDLVYILMPYLSCDDFCDILNVLLQQIKTQERDYEEHLVILKMFWEKSSYVFKNFAKNNSSISEPLQIVLEYDSTETFPMQTFLDSFDSESWLMHPFVI